MTRKHLTERINPKYKKLQKFEPGINFDIQRARFDRLNVNLKIGRANTADKAAVHRLFKRIAGESRLFRNNGGNDYPELVIRTQHKEWLFGGSVKSTNIKNGFSNISASLELNPIRYFVHNTSVRPINRGLYEWQHYYPLYSNAKAQLFAEAGSLDANDNYIPDNRISEAGCIDWARYTTDYMMLAYEFIVMELKRFDTDDILVFPTQPLNWTVVQAEIFWEFEHDNAALIAKDFGAYAGNFYRGKRATDYTVGTGSEGQCYASLFRPDKKKISISLYAKTDNRLRIECRYLGHPKRIYAGKDGDLRNELYDPGLIRDFCAFLPALAQKAREELGSLQHAIRKYDPEHIPNLMGVSLAITSIVNSCGNNPVFVREILRGILTTGRIGETDNKRFKECLKIMEQRGYIRPAGRKPKNKPQQWVLDGRLEDFAAWLKDKH